MLKNKKFSFEEIPFKKQEELQGGNNPPTCACQDACSCYSDEKTSHIALAVDTVVAT